MREILMERTREEANVDDRDHDVACGHDKMSLIHDFKKALDVIIIEFTGTLWCGDPVDFLPDGSKSDDWRAYGNSLVVMATKVWTGSEEDAWTGEPESRPLAVILEQCSKVSDHMKTTVFGTESERRCGIDPSLYDAFVDLRPYIVQVGSDGNPSDSPKEISAGEAGGMLIMKGGFIWDDIIGGCYREWWPDSAKARAKAAKKFRPVSRIGN